MDGGRSPPLAPPLPPPAGPSLRQCRRHAVIYSALRAAARHWCAAAGAGQPERERRRLQEQPAWLPGAAACLWSCNEVVGRLPRPARRTSTQAPMPALLPAASWVPGLSATQSQPLHWAPDRVPQPARLCRATRCSTTSCPSLKPACRWLWRKLLHQNPASAPAPAGGPYGSLDSAAPPLPAAATAAARPHGKHGDLHAAGTRARGVPSRRLAARRRRRLLSPPAVQHQREQAAAPAR